jgi:thiosulfate reductase cytochrome b subunit
MKAATERKIIRWIHIILSIPVIGYIYGPVAEIPEAAMMVRYVFLPVIILSGFYMWKGHLVKKWWRKRRAANVRHASTE